MSWLHWFDNTALVGFYALGLVAIIASLRVVMLANPVHAILSMIVSLLALAGIFIMLGAPFAGALQVIVYAGAILVLFVFVIMMLNLGSENDSRESLWLSSDVWAVPTALSVIIGIVLMYIISMGNSVQGVTTAATIGAQTISAKQVGIALFIEYLLLVEVGAMLLLAALVAAYHLGKKALDDENVSHSSRQVAHSNGLFTNDKDRLTHAKGDNPLHLDEADTAYEYQKLDANRFKQGHRHDSAHLHNREDS